MLFLKALFAFYRQLVEPGCLHEHVKPIAGGGICPDCGYFVQIAWYLLRCRCCGSKRQPKLTPDQQVRPLYKYCQHCGSLDTQLIKRLKIQVYDVTYAVCKKEINYAESPTTSVKYRYQQYAESNPFEKRKPFMTPPNISRTIVEGQVVRKTETVYPVNG